MNWVKEKLAASINRDHSRAMECDYQLYRESCLHYKESISSIKKFILFNEQLQEKYGVDAISQKYISFAICFLKEEWGIVYDRANP